MIRLIRRIVAKVLINNMTPFTFPLTAEVAKRWNHLQSVKLTEGKIKIDWRIIWQGRKLKKQK